MRKATSANDFVLAFKEFCDVAATAVAPKSRGFGLVGHASAESA